MALKALPTRSTRGSRMTRLLGQDAEADEAFWGQEAWQEESSDDAYSTEEEEMDVVDADFDAEERPDEEIHDAEQEENASRRRNTATVHHRMKTEKSDESHDAFA